MPSRCDNFCFVFNFSYFSRNCWIIYNFVASNFFSYKYKRVAILKEIMDFIYFRNWFIIKKNHFVQTDKDVVFRDCFRKS